MIKKGKILLISPNLKGMKGGVNRIQPSLGIGYLAAVLEKEGHEVFIRDTALEGHDNEIVLKDGRTVMIGESDESIANYIVDIKPDIVGISVLFSNLAEHAHTIARIVKETVPDVKVILGGNHISNATLDYQYALSNKDSNLKRTLDDMDDSNIDYAIVGESDFQFAVLVNALLNNQDVTNIEKIIYRKKGNDSSSGNLVVNPRSGEWVDVRQLPLPARHLMNLEGYFKIGLFHSTKSHSKRVLNVMASRGCPENCTFCTTPLTWGSRVRWRDPKDIYKEIKTAIDKYNIGEVQFEDDTLTANKPLLMELCDLIEPLKIPWCTPNGTRVNYHMKTQYEMFKRMADAGCYQITLACESGVQRVLDDIIKKRLYLEQIKPAIDAAKKAGMLVHTFWIVGFPGETREEMEQTIKFASESGADSYSVAILTPLPGTPIYRKIVKGNLWWPNSKGIIDIMYRNSLIKVDGFNSPEEFQTWVDEQNFYLNSLLEKNDPERAKMVKESYGAWQLLKIKQT